MSTPFNRDTSTDRLLELCRRRIAAWEDAAPHSRTEHEQAEAFTRAFAELDAELSGKGDLPRSWAGARHPAERERDIFPVRELLGDNVVRIEKKPGEGL